MIEGKQLDMEINTGALVSLISEAVYRQLWKKQHPALRNTAIILKTYTGENSFAGEDHRQGKCPSGQKGDRTTITSQERKWP